MTKAWKLFSALYLIGLFAAGPGPGLAEELNKENIAARVNGAAISRESVEWAETPLRIPHNGKQASWLEKERQRSFNLALDRLITEELLYQEAVARGIEIEKTKVSKVIRQVKESMPDLEFSRLLVAHWAVKDDVIKNIKRNLMIQQLLRDEVLDKVKVSEGELRQFYDANQDLFLKGEEVRLQQIILFDEHGSQTESKRIKAEELAARARAGENFMTLTRVYSQGPARAKGGDLGWRSLKHLPPLLKAAVPEASVGSTIGPVQVPGGLVIAKVLAKRPARLLPFDEAREYLSRTLREDKLKQRHEAFIRKLRSQAAIEVFLH